MQIRKITVQICGNFWVTQYCNETVYVARSSVARIRVRSDPHYFNARIRTCFFVEFVGS